MPKRGTTTWRLDMGENLNANGAAPVAPYVFLSFLFEIVVKFMFLLSILLLPPFLNICLSRDFNK